MSWSGEREGGGKRVNVQVLYTAGSITVASVLSSRSSSWKRSAKMMRTAPDMSDGMIQTRFQ